MCFIASFSISLAALFCRSTQSNVESATSKPRHHLLSTSLNLPIGKIDPEAQMSNTKALSARTHGQQATTHSSVKRPGSAGKHLERSGIKPPSNAAAPRRFSMIPLSQIQKPPLQATGEDISSQVATRATDYSMIPPLKLPRAPTPNLANARDRQRDVPGPAHKLPPQSQKMQQGTVTRARAKQGVNGRIVPAVSFLARTEAQLDALSLKDTSLEDQQLSLVNCFAGIKLGCSRGKEGTAASTPPSDPEASLQSLDMAHQLLDSKHTTSSSTTGVPQSLPTHASPQR